MKWYTTRIYFSLPASVFFLQIWNVTQQYSVLKVSETAKHPEYSSSLESILYNHQRDCQTPCADPYSLWKEISSTHSHAGTVCIAPTLVLVYMLTIAVFYYSRIGKSIAGISASATIPIFRYLCVIFKSKLCYHGQTEQSRLTPRSLASILTSWKSNFWPSGRSRLSTPFSSVPFWGTTFLGITVRSFLHVLFTRLMCLTTSRLFYRHRAKQVYNLIIPGCLKGLGGRVIKNGQISITPVYSLIVHWPEFKGKASKLWRLILHRWRSDFFCLPFCCICRRINHSLAFKHLLGIVRNVHFCVCSNIQRLRIYKQRTRGHLYF